MTDEPLQSPLPTARMREPRREALRALMLEQIATAAPLVRSRRRIAIAGAAGATALAVGGGVSYAVLTSRAPVTDHNTARCYTSSNYSPGDTFPGTTIAMPDSAPGKGQVGDALSVCADLWRQGILQPGSNRPVRNVPVANYTVPELVQCVLSDGTAAVFPGPPDLCTQMGLQAAQTGAGN